LTRRTSHDSPAPGCPDAKAGVYGGKTFAAPYLRPERGVIYRTDQYKAAGIKSTPKSLAEFRPPARS
jgi:ABC-type glycerol-3-phosphate transport system substrate-binding protein